MRVLHPLATVVAMGLLSMMPARRALAECSPSALDGVRTELRDAAAPGCGPRALRRAFARACDRAASVVERAILQCATARPPRVARAQEMLLGVLARMRRPAMARRLDPTCTDLYVTQLDTLDADLLAAANGTETTTTTVPPGTPTTTTLPPCTTVALDVDKSDCTRVTSDPPRLVECGAGCDEQTFTVPAVGPLRLKGTPAPGDVGVTFGGDCDDDGTVHLGDASPPDCSLSCDCSSGS